MCVVGYLKPRNLVWGVLKEGFLDDSPLIIVPSIHLPGLSIHLLFLKIVSEPLAWPFLNIQFTFA